MSVIGDPSPGTGDPRPASDEPLKAPDVGMTTAERDHWRGQQFMSEVKTPITQATTDRWFIDYLRARADSSGYPSSLNYENIGWLAANPAMLAVAKRYFQFPGATGSDEFIIMDLLTRAPDYATGLVTVFEEAPDLMAVYSNLALPRDADGRTGARLGRTRVLDTDDPQKVLEILHHNAKLAASIADRYLPAGYQDSSGSQAMAFDCATGAAQVWVDGYLAAGRGERELLVRVRLEFKTLESFEPVEGMADFASFKLRVSERGVISSASSMADYGEMGYLFKSASEHSMPEETIMRSLATGDKERIDEVVSEFITKP